MPLYLKDKMVSGVSLGVPGKSAYETAKEGGYAGTEEEFNQALTSVPSHITDTENPHSVTAIQVGAYSKAESDTLLQNKADSTVLQSHITNTENPHGVTATQVGADVAGAANEALNSAKAYTDQIVAGVIPGDGSKESPADSDSIFIYDNADSGKPKKTLISKLVELFNNTFYTKTETNTLLQNNDPRQWGIGSYSGTLITDGNTALLGGAYYWGDSNTNLPFKWGSMRVDPRLTSSIGQSLMQTAYSEGFPGCVAQRQVIDGVFKPWEWVNPPMKLGGIDENGNPINEYRTTERYLGKPVYVQTKEISALAIGSSSSPARTDIENFTDTCDKIVRYEMYVTPASGGAKFPIPFIEATTGVLKASGSLNEGQYLYGSIYSFDDLSGYKANVTCWYTKTTD